MGSQAGRFYTGPCGAQHLCQADHRRIDRTLPKAVKKVIPSDAVLLPDNAQRVFKGMIFDVYQWPQKLYDGSEHTFEMLKRTDTVSAICLVNDKILMLDDEQ